MKKKSKRKKAPIVNSAAVNIINIKKPHYRSERISNDHLMGKDPYYSFFGIRIGKEGIALVEAFQFYGGKGIETCLSVEFCEDEKLCHATRFYTIANNKNSWVRGIKRAATKMLLEINR